MWQLTLGGKVVWLLTVNDRLPPELMQVGVNPDMQSLIALKMQCSLPAVHPPTHRLFMHHGCLKAVNVSDTNCSLGRRRGLSSSAAAGHRELPPVNCMPPFTC